MRILRLNRLRGCYILASFAGDGSDTEGESRMKVWVCMGAILAVLVTSPRADAVDIGRYVKSDSFSTIKISPGGEYFAATVPLDDGRRTALVITERATNKVTGTFMRELNTHIANFSWVNDDRLVISVARKLGALESPQLTGNLFAINADGSQVEILVGQSVAGLGLGTKVQPKKVERVAAFLVDELADSEDEVLISVQPFNADPFTRLERLNVYSGRRMKLTSAPVRNARFVTDNRGVPRFAVGSYTDNRMKLYYRKDGGSDWALIHDEAADGLVQWPIGFGPDDKIAYLEVERAQGPNAIVAFDPETRKSTPVLTGQNGDPIAILYRNNTTTPIGARFESGRPNLAFFDETSDEARLYRSLEAALGGPVSITSRTDDGRLALVATSSDRNPGDLYLYDTVAKKADHVLSRAAWFDPAAMASVEPIQLEARDGLTLRGYVTIPNGSTGKNLPTVVMPHGGPFEVRDTWGFNAVAQMFAEAGYAVLQLNFRGSGGYGNAFVEAGARQWGRAMQDDLTDATQWLIEEGIADSSRICIYGASYGAYAALMGVAKEPDLYQCAAGYVGVYDLPTMLTHGDIQQRGAGQTFLSEWLGDRETIAEVSPNRMAHRIKAPVFLAAGGEDQRAPIAHSQMMERSLQQAGVPVETLYYASEGHGFYDSGNNKAYYTKLLNFLARHLGGEPATNGGSSAE